MATLRPKLEGTATTYGQRVIALNNPKIQSTQSPDRVPQSIYMNSSVNFSTLINSNPSFPQASNIVPNDTLVHVIQNSTGSFNVKLSSSLSSVLSKVAIAAASGDKNPVVVPYGSILYDPNQETGITRSILYNFSNVSPIIDDYFLVKGSRLKSQPDQLNSLKNSQKINLSLVIRSLVSDSVEMNFIKVPNFKANLFYNFFAEGETNITTEEDQALDPLLTKRPADVPRYVDITWTPVMTTQPLRGRESTYYQNNQIRQQLFGAQGGVAGHNSLSFRNSVQKRKKDKNPIVRDGISLSITDINNIEQGFDSLCNELQFANTISLVVETSTQQNNVSNIPIMGNVPSQSRPSGVTPPVQPSGPQPVTNGGVVNAPLKTNKVI